MSNTNFFSGIVKILETPKEHIINDQTHIMQVRVEISQKRKTTMVVLVFWGNLGREVTKFYGRNDYILIEGYSSIRPQLTTEYNFTNPKQVYISVIKVYPILLNSN